MHAGDCLKFYVGSAHVKKECYSPPVWCYLETLQTKYMPKENVHVGCTMQNSTEHQLTKHLSLLVLMRSSAKRTTCIILSLVIPCTDDHGPV